VIDRAGGPHDAKGSGASLRQPVIAARGLSMTFPGVRALGEVDFDVRAGKVHALIGENGAGKSTLIKILSDS
jgi:ABC-type sugar transport system ATPase subunit